MKRFLALTAVLFLLLRPVCDVWGATHGHAEPGDAANATVLAANGHSAEHAPAEFCCAKVQDGNLISPAGVVLASSASDGWFAGSAAVIPMGRKQYLHIRVGHGLDAPPPKLSYYARSSRILR